MAAVTTTDEASKFDDFERVDFRETYDAAELSRFYHDFMRVNFPIDDELDPLEVWEDVLDPAKVDGPLSALPVYLHVVVVYSPDPVGPGEPKKIAGGVVFEYYRMSNACLMSYFAVAPEFRRAGMGRWLVAHAYETCRREAEALRNSGGKTWLERVSRLAPRDEESTRLLAEAAALCTADDLAALDALEAEGHDVSASLGLLFAETNAEGVEDGILCPKVRHGLLNRTGFEALQFGYIQPPLSDTQGACYDLLLLTLQGPPAAAPPRTPSVLVKLFLADFAVSVYGCVAAFADESWWKQMYAELNASGGVVRRTARPPWAHRTTKPAADA